MKRMLLSLVCLLILFDPISAQRSEKTLRWLQRQNVPKWVKEELGALRYESLEISFHLNPFYLRGDFNGDGKVDVAIMIKNKESGKLGIAICHKGLLQHFILGAGHKFHTGWDDFSWMRVWKVYPNKAIPTNVLEEPPPKLIGEAFSAAHGESGSGLIYWDGETYKWYQQGI